jgi:hypothetical protein
MASVSRMRSWATPLTIASFFLMASTGMLMFFELDGGLTAVVHQWFSWLFVLGAASHIVTNARSFKNHLATLRGQATMAVLAAVLLASFFSWGRITGPQLKRPIELALVDAPLSALASTTHTPADVLLGRLSAQGVTATAEQSVRELSSQYGVGENRLLGIVFLPGATTAAR